MEFNKTLQEVKPSLTLELVAKVKALKSQGVDVVSFTVGEPDFPTPDYIKEEAIKAINEGFTKYTAATGIIELKEAIVERLKRDFNVEYQKENIAISNGAKHTISNVFYTLLNSGDEVIIPAPYWLSYPEMVKLCSGKCVFVETSKDNGYKLTAEALQKVITDKTKLLILNSPNNPTGSVYTKEDLEPLIPIIKESGVAVISDDIYDKLIYTDVKFTSLAEFSEIKDQVILVNGVSKAYAMTGWRIGYCAADKKLIGQVGKIQSNFTSSPCSVSQRAALAAISGDDRALPAMKEKYSKRRKLALSLFEKIPNLPVYPSEGAFYLFPQCNAYFGKSYSGGKIEGSMDLAKYLLEECHVAVVPGMVFGANNNFRISYATSEEEIEKGIGRIHEGLAKLT